MLVRQKSASPGRQLNACDWARNPGKHSRLFFETASFSEFPTSQSGSSLRPTSLIRNRSSRSFSGKSHLKNLFPRLGMMDSCVGSDGTRGADELDPARCRAPHRPDLTYLRDVEEGRVVAPKATIPRAERSARLYRDRRVRDDLKGFLFRTSRGRRGDRLSEEPMTQTDAWRMVRRRDAAAGLVAPIGCHAFGATGITAYLATGASWSTRRRMAAHESPRTTKLYDRTRERLAREEVERIRL
jgi:hypothetical protein